ncbi:MAG: hypothetical protein IPI73_25560 [Betaproteobacteria bacterium]|nr:hypothetical protein [Betaproteobacteria bacterium]
MPFFAMKFLVDYPRVKLYKESQLEWLRDERGLPYWTYDAPNMLRDRNWLASWGAPMLRSFGVSKLSIVDVRPAESYKQGHVPYAVNIPAAVFKSHLATPAELAEVLGAAGVEMSHEAVIVADGGLNASAALAFLLLESSDRKILRPARLHRRLGTGRFPLAKDATTVGPRKSPQDLAVPITTYPANVRRGIVARGAQGAQGPYPKIYLASGRTAPAKAPDGKGNPPALHRSAESRRHAESPRTTSGTSSSRPGCRATPRSSASPTIRARPRPTTSS